MQEIINADETIDALKLTREIPEKLGISNRCFYLFNHPNPIYNVVAGEVQTSNHYTTERKETNLLQAIDKSSLAFLITDESSVKKTIVNIIRGLKSN